MAGPGGIDSSSPFFSSLASQAALQQGVAKNREKKKDSPLIGRFDSLFKTELSEESDKSIKNLSAHLVGLPKDKILEKLLDEVHSSGDALKEKPLPDNILAYKNAIRSFISFVVEQTYIVTESTSGGNILKRKKFMQLEVIDQKLEQLAAGILSNQKTQLSLLEKIEEINGLLVDLLS